MISANPKATIIGAGIGGLTAAIALARNGVQVEIYEQASRFEEIGAGLQLAPNATRALHALGIDLTRAPVERPKYTQVLRNDGLKLLRGAQNQKGQTPYYQIHRADLIALLVSFATSLGVHIHLNSKISAQDIADDRLIIAADGMKSTHRPQSDTHYSGHVAWRAVIPCPTDFARDETHLYLGTNRHLVLYPLRKRKLLNIVAISKCADPTALSRNHADLKDAFGDFSPAVQTLLERIDRVQIWPLNIHAQPIMCGRYNTILLGDAAQTMVPFMAQGAAMAIEDAYLLARLAPRYHGGDLAQRYEMMRAPRRARMMATSLRNGAIFHEARPLIRPALHITMMILARVHKGFLTQRHRWIYNYDITRLKV